MQLQADLLSDAQRAGIDLDLIDTNLALPINERWRQHASLHSSAAKGKARK
jgi:hypothetical protein